MTNKVYIKTMGCPKNQVDSRQMAGMLRQDGFCLVDAPQAAEIIILNTCGFVDAAKEESIEAILELAQYKSIGQCQQLIMVGCLVQKYGAELAEALPEVDMFLGTSDWTHLVQYIEQQKKQQGYNRLTVGRPEEYLFNNEWSLDMLAAEPHTGYVKIAEGCDHRCAYCVIPMLRGVYRSRPKEDIVFEVKERVKAGLREAVLIAQDTGCYGKDLKPRETLASLLRALCEIEDLRWIRIMYCYPEEVTQDLLEAMQHEKVCAYIDMPIQHVSDSVLLAMGRPLSSAKLKEKIQMIRQALPEVFIRTTLMVGFPGETQENFAEMLDFLKEYKLERAGFFAFSPQPGTRAEKMPGQVPEPEKERRLNLAQSIQAEILAEKEGTLIGRVVWVMVDGRADTDTGEQAVVLWEGRTQWDAPEIDGLVIFRGNSLLKPGDLVPVRITHSHEFTLLGELVHESC